MNTHIWPNNTSANIHALGEVSFMHAKTLISYVLMSMDLFLKPS